MTTGVTVFDWIVSAGAENTEDAKRQRFPQEGVDDPGTLPTGEVSLEKLSVGRN